MQFKLEWMRKDEASLELQYVREDDSYCIRNLHVTSAFRHQGLASELLRRACFYIDRYHRAAYLFVVPSPGIRADRLVELYERFGFRKPEDTGAAMDKALMVREARK